MKKLFLVLILLIGITLRFYKLDWGDGLFPHPDERNIAGGIMNLSFPYEMNPKFFAYGGFPLYLYYFTGFVLNVFLPKFHLLSFDNMILIGRFWSAFFSSLTLIFFYQLCKKFLNQNFSIFAVLLLSFTPGMIQQAHFATVETLMAFFLVTITLLIIKYLESGKRKYVLLAGILAGLAVGTKTTCLLFLPPIFLVILVKEFIQPLIKLFSTFRHSNPIQNQEALKNPEVEVTPRLPDPNMNKTRISFKFIFKFISVFVVCCLLFVVCFSITNPYAIIDHASFRGTMNYETGVGLGNPIVFYTQQFQKTIPVIFQFTKIFPYTLGPSVTLFAVFGILIFSYNALKHRKLSYILYLISFFLYLVPNLIIFAKWTRFVAPVFPFFVFFAVYFVYKIRHCERSDEVESQRNPAISGTIYSKISIFFASLLLISTILWGMAFFSIYTHRDVRWTASDWMIANLKPQSQILFETGNVIDIPLGGYFTRTSYDFFHIDEGKKQDEFFSEVEKADYFLIQSRRVWANYPRLPETHPTTAKFYDLLWSGKLGFEKIAEFDSFPQLFGIKINDELAEETFTVFDHPHMSVWKKIIKYSKDSYGIFFR